MITFRTPLAIIAFVMVGQTASASSGTGDFDGDGRDDVLLRHERSGGWLYHSFADAAAQAHALALPADNGHRFMGIGDFDGDGRHDALFQHKEDGAWLYYAVQSPNASPGVVRREDFGVASDPAFELRGIGDLNGDGNHDLLFRNADTGAWRVYFMDGAGAEVHDGLRATRNRSYAFAGLADFNGDGRDDLLLRHGNAGAWISYEVRADGRGVLRRPAITRNRAYGFEGIGDLNGDGRDDVLLRHEDTGQWIYYQMNGARAALRRVRGMTQDSVYRRIAVGDFDGDGMDSVLVRHAVDGDWIEYGVSAARAVATRHAGLVRDVAWHGVDAAEAAPADGPWTTDDGRIVLEVAPGDVTGKNPFDLDGRSVIFLPDGDGAYAREVRRLEWESNVGDKVSSGAEVQLPFGFDFGGRTQRAVTVHRQGLLTFDDEFQDPYWELDKRFVSMAQQAQHFALTPHPAIAPLWKPWALGSLHVSTQTDRVVVTWSVTDWMFHVHGVAPRTRSQFQAVLHADGGVAFHYRNVDFGDGLVGLFTGRGVVKGELIARIEDPTDATVPGYLDLTSATIHRSNLGAGVVVEFTTRDPIPELDDGISVSYRLYFDVDEPHWRGFDGSDLDFWWEITLSDDGDARTWPGTLLPRKDANRIALFADAGDLSGISASVIAEAVQWEDGAASRWEQAAPTSVPFPIPPPAPDLSEPGAVADAAPHEAFHFRSMADLRSLGCRIVEQLGDGYDLLVFHSEFRMDVQEDLTPWYAYLANVGVTGVGLDGRDGLPPCESDRLKGQWVLPIWIKAPAVADDSRPAVERFERGSFLFAHEFTHSWTAHLSFARNESHEPLFGVYCRCHWRDELHTPAAFSWRAHAGNRSIMGGEHWRENADGSFSRMSRWEAGGFSWLDLYAMGLADANEVPESFLLRDLRRVGVGADGRDLYRGEKEVVTIDQIIAAEGPRVPAPADAQTVFNAGFVYLVEPGKTPDADMLALHRAYRDQVVADWASATGGRSEITTRVPDPATVRVLRRGRSSERPPLRDYGRH